MEKRFVYLGYSEKKQLWKIGVTNNVQRRAKQLGIRIEHVIEVRPQIAGIVETLLHKHYRYMDTHMGHEWYQLSEQSVREIKAINTEENIEVFGWSRGWRHVDKLGWVAVEMGATVWETEMPEIIREHRRIKRQVRR